MAISGDSSKIPSAPVADPPPPPVHRAVNPAALTVEQLARAIGLPVETVRQHVGEGAPVGADGTINLVQYAAWLNKRLVTAEPEAKPDGD
jgi:hypothetical protein